MGAIRGAPVELVKCETVRSPRAGQRRDRDRRLSRPRSLDLHDGRPVCRIHRLCRGRPFAQADHSRHRHHPSQRPDPARHDRRRDAGLLFRERHVLLDHALGDRVERARSRRRSRRHRCVVSAGARRHQYDGPDQAELSRPGQASGQRDVGQFGRPRALQARHRGRRRHRHSRLRRRRLGDRLSRQCRRGRHRHHAGHVRRWGSIHRRASATATPRCSAPANGIAC